ncbi:MAG: hypothetical protein Q7S12_01180 [bacterium]|nr:hypothetical protein [bacterium]
MKDKNPNEAFASIIRDLDYNIDWKVKAMRQGMHKSVDKGSGLIFRDITRITDAPGQRRLDVRSSIRSSDGIPRVRIFEQKSALKVMLVADLSASLSYSGFVSKREEMAKFAVVLGYSAYRIGDAFGFLGYSDKVEFYEPPVFSKATAFDAARRIWESDMNSHGHKAIAEIAEHLPKEKSLIFWFSDFYFPEKEIEEFMALVGNYHDVRAVSFIDSSEINLPRFGFAALKDPERGGKRQVFIRPSIRKKIAKTFDEKRKRLESLFARYGNSVYFNIDDVNAKEIQDWLLK